MIPLIGRRSLHAGSLLRSIWQQFYKTPPHAYPVRMGGICMPNDNASIAALIEKHQQTLLSGWLAGPKAVRPVTRHGQRVRQPPIRPGSFSNSFAGARRPGSSTTSRRRIGPGCAICSRTCPVRVVAEGFSPSETATFVFSLKEPLFEMLRPRVRPGRGAACHARPGRRRRLLDKLGCSPSNATREPARR